MALTLSWKLTLAYGAECKWEVPEKDITEMEQIKFVQLRQGGVCFGFPRLVFHEASSQGVHLGPKERWSLSSSEGYQALQKLRNDAQSQELLAKLPEWQRNTAKVKKNKKQKKQDGPDAKECRSSLSIEVPGVGDAPSMEVRVVRPIRAHEELRVELRQDVIDHIVKFVAISGFDAVGRKRGRDPEVPKGVYRRKVNTDGMLMDQFVVVANKRWKRLGTIEEAVLEQELLRQGVDGDGESDKENIDDTFGQ